MHERLSFASIERFWRLKQQIRALTRAGRSRRMLHLPSSRRLSASARIMEKAYLMQLRLHLEQQLVLDRKPGKLSR